MPTAHTGVPGFSSWLWFLSSASGWGRSQKAAVMAQVIGLLPNLGELGCLPGCWLRALLGPLRTCGQSASRWEVPRPSFHLPLCAPQMRKSSENWPEWIQEVCHPLKGSKQLGQERCRRWSEETPACILTSACNDLMLASLFSKPLFFAFLNNPK